MFDYFIGFMQSMVTFFYEITADFGFPSYGLAIILFTVVIKALLFPLTAKQMKSMQAMKLLGPQMKVLQAKYKNDKLSCLECRHNIDKTNSQNNARPCQRLKKKQQLALLRIKSRVKSLETSTHNYLT